LKPRAFVFDAYGTLFDVHSVVFRADNIPGDLQALSTLWRQKQLEYIWLRALMQRYEDFWDVTEAALRSSLGQLQIETNEWQIQGLLQAFLAPATFPDVKPALDTLALRGPMAILSNGSPKMLESAVHDNGLSSYFAEIISVDRVKTYKPSPLVYALACEALSLAPQEILFVSSNSWDVAGAKAFGFQVCWCNRSKGSMEELGLAADLTVFQLDQIEGCLERK
jgi:2-haloacid dehalogenase